ncbi:MAG TPA: response regulator [Kofleriaceae bacterium]|nr:response regulator [Kofleriaceae bacterium]
MSLARPTVLVIHDDGAVLDVLTRLFEASGCEVPTAATGSRAQAYLEGNRPVDLVVVPWDAVHPVGGELYRWSLQRRYDLRDGFVFLTAETPPEFDRLVAGRCLGVSPAQPEEIIRVAIAAIKRRQRLGAARGAALEIADATRPTLLLADDEPVLLRAMADLLSEAGYAVWQVDSGRGAIVLLQDEDFDAIVADWNMDDGSGADIYRWIVLVKPWLAERVVFLADAEGQDATMVAPGRPMFRKGQDSHELTTVLRGIVRQVRGEPAPF